MKTIIFLGNSLIFFVCLQATELTPLLDLHLTYYELVLVSFTLFFSAILKIFFTKKNLLLIMLGVEIMMLSIIFFVLSCFNSICFLNSYNFLIVFVLLTIVVSESVIGLVLILLLSKHFGSIDLKKLNKLRG